ncbi:MAG: hypothetical protein II702_04145 [Clostridia bacterium]|nr:hypothetical protein [Clostridia bacterium]
MKPAKPADTTMKNRIIAFMNRLDNTDISAMSDGDLESYRKDLMTQISFFQHERLIHLIVTITFAILTFITLAIGIFGTSMAYIMLFFFIVLLIPYIKHYFLLENGVEKMYPFYDALVKEEDKRRREAENKADDGSSEA